MRRCLHVTRPFLTSVPRRNRPDGSNHTRLNVIPLYVALSLPPTRPFSRAARVTGTYASTVSAAAAAASAAASAAAQVDQPSRRASLLISDVLHRFDCDSKTFTVLGSQTLYDAVQIMVSSRTGCLVVMEEDGEHVAGLVTERDILAEIVNLEMAEVAEAAAAAAAAEGETGGGTDNVPAVDAASDPSSLSVSLPSAIPRSWRTTSIRSAMTRSREMVHIKPSDRIDDALRLMTSQGFRHLPVLVADVSSGGHHLAGIVSMRNLVDVVYRSGSVGGKAQFLQDILPRTGVPKNTSLRKRGTAAGHPYRCLYLNAGVASIPHPEKRYGEDSYVAILGGMEPAVENGRPEPFSCVAVFDGVGSWSFEQGIDPAKFSNTLSAELKRLVDQYINNAANYQRQQAAAADAAAAAAALAAGDSAATSLPSASTLISSTPASVAATALSTSTPALSPSIPASASSSPPSSIPAPASSSPSSASPIKSRPQPQPPAPASLLSACWTAASSHKVVGSSTASILTLTHQSHELRAANIGDSGFIILRHRDTMEGTLGSVGATAIGTTPSYHVVFRSPQQLHYFNCPFQLGVGINGETDKFDAPVDADVLSVPVREGDIIVLATDGLFDNVPEELIIEAVSEELDHMELEMMARNDAALSNPSSAPSTTSSATSAVVTSPSPPNSSTPPLVPSLPPCPSYAVHNVAGTPIPCIEGPVSPLQSISSRLASLALSLSIDKSIDSPFALLAKENNILWKNGGRKDDITVIVARVEALQINNPETANAAAATLAATAEATVSGTANTAATATATA